MSLNYDVIPEILNTVRSIEDEYQHNQGPILTESDVGSLLIPATCRLLLIRVSQVRDLYGLLYLRAIPI